MSIDMAQFHQVFFEESFEGLAVMESGLLNLDMGDVDLRKLILFLERLTLLKEEVVLSVLMRSQNLLILWKPCLMKCVMAAGK